MNMLPARLLFRARARRPQRVSLRAPAQQSASTGKYKAVRRFIRVPRSRGRTYARS